MTHIWETRSILLKKILRRIFYSRIDLKFAEMLNIIRKHKPIPFLIFLNDQMKMQNREKSVNLNN